MSTVDELRARHAEYMALFNEAAADEGGVEHWKKTHRTEWLADHLIDGKTRRLMELAAEVKRRHEEYEGEKEQRAMPPTLGTLADDAAAVGTLECWTADELANAGRNLGQAIYAKGCVDTLLFIAGMVI